MMIEVIRREISRALAGVRGAFRGAVTAYRYRAPDAVLVQASALAGEALQDAELFQQAGFTSGLPAGTQMIVLPLGGKTVHAVIIATEYGKYRVECAPGEVALYHLTEPDCWVHLKAGRVIAARCARLEVEADEAIALKAPTVTVEASTSASFDTPLLSTNQDLHVGADATIRQASGNPYTLGELVEKYDRHDHVEHDNGGPTDPPKSADQIGGA